MLRRIGIWTGFAALIAVPLIIAAGSAQLAWRQPIYIAASFAGIIGLACLLMQPLLIGQGVPGLSPLRARHLHRATGGLLVLAVVLHVAGLWITSPPDVVDALLLRSPTPFSLWGVIAMWAVFITATLAAIRKRVRLTPRLWRRAHTVLAAIIVGGTILHAVLIDGIMGPVSKVILCLCVAVITAKVLWHGKVWTTGKPAQ